MKAVDIPIGTKYLVDGVTAQVIAYSKQGDEVVILEDESGSKVWPANINDIQPKPKGMGPKEAIRFLSTFQPCPHGDFDPNLGDGKTWAKCEDCGETFERSRLALRQARFYKFEEAVETLWALIRAGE